MKTKTYTTSIAAALSLLCAALSPAASAEGDAARGAEIGYSCLGCHGIDGYRNAYPSYRVPKLGGQKAAYLTAALQAYRDGTRQHPTMNAQGASLSDQEITDVVAWLAGYGEVSDEANASNSAGVDAVQACLACHGDAGAAVLPQPPTLSGQHLDYLMHSLAAYKNGSRAGTVMTAFASPLSDDDIETVAAFYASRPGLTTTQPDDE